MTSPEKNYSEIEKHAFCVVNASSRLKPYFISYDVIVLTHQPLKQVLGKPEKSGRLAKWAIQLGELNIEYQSPTAKKAQVLADFLASYPPQVEEPSSNSKMDESLSLVAQISEPQKDNMDVQDDLLPPPPEGEAPMNTHVVLLWLGNLDNER